MKYEGQQYPGSSTDPSWFKDFLYHYSGVIRFLTQFNTSRLSMGTDVNMNTSTPLAKVTHGVETTVPHGMSTTPTRAIIMGRVEAVHIKNITSTAVTFTAKLLSTTILDRSDGLSANSVYVSDSTLFRIGDVVRWGNSTRSISGINGNKVSFSSAVTRGTVDRMILDRDEVRLTVF